MPTNLPVRRKVQDEKSSARANLHALLLFYVGFGLAALLLVEVEIKFGVIETLGAATLAIEAPGTDVVTDEAYAIRSAWHLPPRQTDDGSADAVQR